MPGKMIRTVYEMGWTKDGEPEMIRVEDGQRLVRRLYSRQGHTDISSAAFALCSAAVKKGEYLPWKTALQMAAA